MAKINLFNEKTILLGITGSIAAYKSADLASKLTQAGADVNVIFTQAAMKFIAPLTFQSVTGRRAYTDEDLWGQEGHVQHIGLGKKANLLVIAPATANTIGKLAHGIADNLLTVTALATRCPIMVAPAMDGGMFTHAATQSNLDTLRQRGVIIVGPAEGHLASGMAGIGRMVEPRELLGHVRLALAQDGPLSGIKVIVTAGGTQEPIDPVRTITNRSSGKQGFALAQASLDRGAEVTLISAPTHLQTPVGVRRVDVRTAEEMHQAVLASAPKSNVLIMAAAVADFHPIMPSQDKIKKESGIPEIKLETTTDILGAVATQKSETKHPQVLVGFAAESKNLIDNARAKLRSKQLDLIVANDITDPDSGFGVDTNRVTLLDAGGGTEMLPLMTKTEVAESVMTRVVQFLKAT